MDNIELIRTTLEPVFRANNVRLAILFGSFAKGSEKSHSDFDFYVDSGLRGLRFCGLVEDVRNALAQTRLGDREVDMFDVRHVKQNSPMEQEILNTGVKIYGSI